MVLLSLRCECYAFFMGVDTTVRRRLLGAAALLAALVLLIAGQTVLQGRLGAFAFVVYWLICLLLTCLAVLVAIADARAVRHRIRQEQRQLLEATLKHIESKARVKAKTRGLKPGKFLD